MTDVLIASFKGFKGLDYKSLPFSMTAKTALKYAAILLKEIFWEWCINLESDTGILYLLRIEICGLALPRVFKSKATTVGGIPGQYLLISRPEKCTMTGNTCTCNYLVELTPSPVNINSEPRQKFYWQILWIPLLTPLYLPGWMKAI